MKQQKNINVPWCSRPPPLGESSQNKNASSSFWMCINYAFSLSVRGVKSDVRDEKKTKGGRERCAKKRRRAQKKRTTNKERGGKVDREEILTRRTNVHIQKKKNIRVLYLVRSWKDLRRLAARDNNNNTFGKRAFSDLRATTTTS